MVILCFRIKLGDDTPLFECKPLKGKEQDQRSRKVGDKVDGSGNKGSLPIKVENPEIFVYNEQILISRY